MPPSTVAGRRLVQAAPRAPTAALWGASHLSLSQTARLQTERAALDAALARLRCEQQLEQLESRRQVETARLAQRLRAVEDDRNIAHAIESQMRVMRMRSPARR